MPVISEPRLLILLCPWNRNEFLATIPAAFDARAITSRASPHALYDASQTTSPSSSVSNCGVPIWSQW